MSDPTKKSIVINTSFLSSSGAGSELNSTASRNKSRKHTRQKIPDEVIKPSKLKQMLLDKINAKRKAELTMTTAAATNSLSTNPANHKKGFTSRGDIITSTSGGIDKEKEARIFSDEFKKSLSFLDKYIQTKQTEKSEKHQHRQNSKTLKKPSGTNSTSLNEDILKSLHSNRNKHGNNQGNHNTSPHQTPLNVNTQLYQKPSATYGSNIMQRSVSPSRPVSSAPTPTHAQRGVSFATQSVQPHAHTTATGFQKIQLNVPKVNNNHVTTYASAPKNEKITLALGKPNNAHGTTMTDAGNLIYTELPPELMPTAPMPAPMLTILPDPIPRPIPSHIIEPFVSPSPSLSLSSSLSPSLSPSPSHSPIPSTTLSTSTSTFSPIKLTDDKPYGCLKHGKKPTFRLYNKTIKHSHSYSHSHSDTQNTENENESVLYSERQQKLNDLRNKHNPKPISGSSSSYSHTTSRDDKHENDEKGEKGEKRENKINNSTSSSRATKIRKRLRKTITKRFKLGKQGNVVGVLIKNNDTRKKIQKEHSLLKNKNLSDVKKYLVEQKLIKIGSTAPPNIIRKIYEDSVLTGEVENVGKDVILHNFLEQNKPW